MNTDFEPFDDPALKAAMKRLYAHEAAPAALRTRIAGLLSGQPAIMPASGQSYRPTRHSLLLAFWRRPALQAVAAGFVIGVIGLVVAVYLMNLRRSQGPDYQTLVSLIRTHDAFCSDASHSTDDLPAKDLHLIARTISSKLHDPVFAADLQEDGWQFKGARICSVGTQRSAHMMFAKQGLRMSVFSMPAPNCGSQRRIFKREVDGHMVAGFTSKGRLYCLVGTCPKHKLRLDEVASLLEKHQDELEMPSSPVAHVTYTPSTILH